MSSVNTYLCIVFIIIFHANYRWIFLRQYPKRCISKFPCNLESHSEFRFSTNLIDELQRYSLENMNRNVSILLSNGEDKGDSGEKSEEPAESKEETPPAESKEEPPPAEEPPQPQQQEEPKDEPRETPGIPPVPETKSRIPTYDEFARYRNSSRPPDSHYYGPPGPGPFDRRRRAKATALKCHFLLTIFGVGTSLDRAYLF